MLDIKVEERLLKKAGIEKGVISEAEDVFDDNFNQIENCYLLVNVDESDERVWSFRVVGKRIYGFEQII